MENKKSRNLIESIRTLESYTPGEKYDEKKHTIQTRTNPHTGKKHNVLVRKPGTGQPGSMVGTFGKSDEGVDHEVAEEIVADYLNAVLEGGLNEDTSEDAITEALTDVLELAEAIQTVLEEQD